MAISGEALLISALLNTEDTPAAASFGIRPEHFRGYRDEYNWLLNYYATYGKSAGRDVFSVAFPRFEFSDHDEIRSAVDQVFKQTNKAKLRESITEMTELLQIGDVTEAYEIAKGVMPLRTGAKSTSLLTDVDFLETWDEEVRFIEVPYRSLQKMTGGIREGQIWYVAARPKNGKTSHLISFICKALEQGVRTKFYSLEMSKEEVRSRFHAAFAHRYGIKEITLRSIRDRSVDAKVYREFVGSLEERLGSLGGVLDIHTPAEGLVTPGLIQTTAGNYELNAVDYIGLMRADVGARAVDDWRILASISNDLKLIAAAEKTSMLVASQINRSGDQGHEPPKLANLSGSDALGQDGDVILTLRAQAKDTISAWSIEGNRHGPAGRFFTTFSPNTGEYREITPEEAEEFRMDADLRDE